MDESSALTPIDRDLLRRAQWRVLVRALPWTMGNNCIAALLLAYLLSWSEANGEAIAWFALMLVLTLVRVVYLRQAARTAVLNRKPLRARVGIVLGIGASGLLWGLAAAWLVSLGDLQIQAVICFFAAGLTAGAAASYSPILSAYSAFSLPFLLLLTGRLAIEETSISLVMAAGVLAFAVGMFAIACNTRYHVTEALRLWLVNRRLNRDLLLARENEQSAEQRALELRRAKERADAATETKSRFLATVSHELRTPLNAVIGFSDLIASEVHGPIGNERYREYSRDIHASGEHLLQLIDDILDLSKLERGGNDLELERIELLPLCEHVVRTFCSPVEGEESRLRFTVEPPKLAVIADPRLLRQIMLNLVGNALKFSLPESVVLIDCRRLSTGQLRLRVQDFGIGIPTAQLESVTEAFVQGTAVPGASSKGAGLGLSIVKTFVDLHGGTLLIESEEGTGTTVDVILPDSAAEFSVEGALSANAASDNWRTGRTPNPAGWSA